MGVTPRVGSIPTSGTLARSRSLERRSWNQALDLRRCAPRSSGTIPTSGTNSLGISRITSSPPHSQGLDFNCSLTLAEREGLSRYPTQTALKKFGFSLLHEDGTEIIKAAATDNPFDFSHKGIAILDVGSPTFKKPGKGTLTLTGDGEEVYRTSFSVLQAGPDTFKR